jgi:hypothetical protein
MVTFEIQFCMNEKSFIYSWPFGSLHDECANTYNLK